MKKRKSIFLINIFLFSLLTIAAPLQTITPSKSHQNTDYELEVAFPNLSFTNIVDLQDPGDGTSRLFVVEQAGFIEVFANSPDVSTSTIFLDISGKVSGGSEQGLLGLAFHPDFISNGYFFIDYTDINGQTIIARYQVDSSNNNKADPDSEEIILVVNQPFSNHNAGQILFGHDNYLYVTLGDGGLAGDPSGNGQNPATLLGSILRIDVDNPDSGKNYGIPPNNPLVSSNELARKEIYAYGLRNPFRLSQDPVTGWLWAGDVGQNRYEEVDLIWKGHNYGWNVMEGFHCFSPLTNCDQTGLTLPIVEYERSKGISVIGGYVYRGNQLPSLFGSYIYGDLTGQIWALEFNGIHPPVVTELVKAEFSIPSFGTDSRHNLYILDYSGKIYQFKSEQTAFPNTPQIISPNNVTYIENSLGTLIWNVQDNNPAFFTLYRDELVITNSSWDTISPIDYSLANLSTGIYNFTLIVSDGDNNIAVDIIWVNIIADDTTYSFPSQTLPIATSESVLGFFVMQMISGLLLASVLILRKRSRNRQIKK